MGWCPSRTKTQTVDVLPREGGPGSSLLILTRFFPASFGVPVFYFSAGIPAGVHRPDPDCIRLNGER